MSLTARGWRARLTNARRTPAPDLAVARVAAGGAVLVVGHSFLVWERPQDAGAGACGAPVGSMAAPR